MRIGYIIFARIIPFLLYSFSRLPYSRLSINVYWMEFEIFQYTWLGSKCLSRVFRTIRKHGNEIVLRSRRSVYVVIGCVTVWANSTWSRRCFFTNLVYTNLYRDNTVAGRNSYNTVQVFTFHRSKCQLIFPYYFGMNNIRLEIDYVGDLGLK